MILLELALHAAHGVCVLELESSSFLLVFTTMNYISLLNFPTFTFIASSILRDSKNNAHMGGGAGPAGQVLAGPLFCLINEQLLFINKRRVLGLTYLFAIFLSVSLNTRWTSRWKR